LSGKIFLFRDIYGWNFFFQKIFISLDHEVNPNKYTVEISPD
jgi:hypothetical protein